MPKTFFPFFVLLILISCQKKLNDNFPADNEQNLAGIRASNSILNELNEVDTPDDPPISILNDLTIQKPDGASVVVITASEYNALGPVDQIYYTALRNAFQYLFQDAANTSTNLQFNEDGSYIITVNTNPPGGNSDDDGGSGGSCTVCGLNSAYGCKNKIKKYMTDNGLTTITATISLVTVDGENCVKIVYKDDFEPPGTPPDGTVIETYTPPTSQPNQPNPPTFTFPFLEFDNYIADVLYWYYHIRPIPEEGVIDQSSMTRLNLISIINEFNSYQWNPPHEHQNDAAFQVQLAYYIRHIWIANPIDSEE